MFSKKPKSAYILAMREHPDMNTLVLDYGRGKPATYFPFESQKDIVMALDLLKTAGIKVEEKEVVSVE